MAIVLEANYAKKLGLPNYSSHQYSVTIRTELTDLTQVEEASTHLYGILQAAVDREIQHVGFMPDASTYGMNPSTNGNGNGGGGGNGHQTSNSSPSPDDWQCSDKQRRLILDIIQQNRLDKRDVEQLAQEMFTTGVKSLNRLQASGLIDELIERHGGKRGNGHRQRGRFQSRGAGR